MSEKQSEITANPETDQVDGSQVRSQPEMSSNGELLLGEAGHKQHEAVSVQNQKLRGTDPLNDETRQLPLNRTAEPDASNCHSDAQSAVRELSDGDGCKMRGRAKNPEDSEVSGQRSTEKCSLTYIRCERDPVENIGSGKTAYFVVHDNRGLVDVHKKSDAGERNSTTTSHSTPHDLLEKVSSQSAVGKGRGGACGPGDDGLVTNSSSDPEQGYSSDSLLLPDARKKGRSSVPTFVRGKVRRSTTTWYEQPVPEGRDIFEAGGEESQNPRLNTLRGVVHDGSDRIERLAVESSVEESPVIETPPVTSEVTSPSSSDIMERKVGNPVSGCVRLMWRWMEGQFFKAPIFYLLSAIVAFFALAVFHSKEEDLDVLVCLLATIGFCILLTVLVPRGSWSKSGEKIEGVGIFSGRFSGLCGECYDRHEQTPLPQRRHSQYYHPLEEDAHTVFEHEIADVSNIDPKDCPQMKMVDEQETVKSDSPDSTPDFRQLNVDIHAEASPKNSEEAATARKLAKTRTRSKSKSSSAPLKGHKDSKAEEVPIPQTGAHPEDRLNADLSRYIPEASTTLRSTLTSLLAATYNVKEFVCEHDGQGVACSCFADSCKQDD